MLPDAALHVVDRLITALMTLLDAVAAIAIPATRTGTPTAHGQAAQLLVFRLTTLVTTLLRIGNFGIRPPRDLDLDRAPPDPAPPDPAPPDPAEPSDRAPCLPRRPGWLLAILPDIAPAIAADLGLILADPAFADLLASAPSLHRTLRPLLRALGLTAAAPFGAPPPLPGPPAPCPPPEPTPPSPEATPFVADPPRRNRQVQSTSLYVHIVPQS